MRKGAIRRRLARELGTAYQTLRQLLLSALSTAPLRGRFVRSQPVQCNGFGIVSCGDDVTSVTFGWWLSPGFYSGYAYLDARSAMSRITIGGGTRINNNFSAIAEHTNITIGRRCLLGVNVSIVDSDFHGLPLADRHRSAPMAAEPVSIGDDVFIGSNVTILKGVHIGNGAVVGSGAVVTKSVPPLAVAGGNPAKVIRHLDSEP